MDSEGRVFSRTQGQRQQHVQERIEGQEVTNGDLVRMNPVCGSGCQLQTPRDREMNVLGWRLRVPER